MYMTNCPNCGAPITGWRCEYCETVFDISKEEKLRTEINLTKAKIQHFNNTATLNKLYEDAIRAMRDYARN